MTRDTFVKISKIGFEVGVVSDNMCRIYSDAAPSRDMLLSMFELLGENDEICFWNYFFLENPVPGDPGSYVSSIIFKGMAYCRDQRIGNLTEIRCIPLFDMADIIIRTWDKNIDANDLYRNCIYIRYNSIYAREARTEYYIPHIRFDGWMNFADTLIWLGFMMSIILAVLMTVTVKEQLFIPIILITFFVILFVVGLYMRLEYNRTAAPWRWKKRVDKHVKYRLTLNLNGTVSELKKKAEAKKMLNDFYAKGGRYDITVDPPMGGISGLSGYNLNQSDTYVIQFKTITERGEQFRYLGIRGRTNEDYLMILRLIKRKKISLENYGFEEPWKADNPFIEEPRSIFREVILPPK